LITYNGIASNSGNVILNNITVINAQSSPSAVLTLPSLAPGASASFTASFATPLDACSVSSSVAAYGSDNCSALVVSNSASATCSLTTAPGIVVTEVCPVKAVAPGGLLTYSGVVSNSGNITLTNVIVLNNRSGPTPIFTAATMSPGTAAAFSGSFTAPAECSVTSISTATGQSLCGVSVTNKASAACAIVTTPRLALVQTCAFDLPTPGGQIAFSGMVSNSGNILLTNVVIYNDRVGATPVFAVATLAPGATGSFTGSYLAPTNCDSLSVSTASATSLCGQAVSVATSSTCQIATTPIITVTQECPQIPTLQGGILTYTGTVANNGDIPLTNIVVVNNWPAANTVIFTAPSLAPGQTASFTGSYVVTQNCCVAWSTVKASGQDCSGQTVTDTDSGTCSVYTAPKIIVTKVCPATAPRHRFELIKNRRSRLKQTPLLSCYDRSIIKQERYTPAEEYLFGWAFNQKHYDSIIKNFL
jgi:uncharacterized repeat protein (TIGR01451 family)